MFPLRVFPKLKTKLDKPPASLAAKALLAAKPYLERGKDNPGVLAMVSNLEMLAGIAEMSPGFQEGFNAWIQDVKRIEVECQKSEKPTAESPPSA